VKIGIIGSRGYHPIFSGFEIFVRDLALRLVRQGGCVTAWGLDTPFSREMLMGGEYGLFLRRQAGSPETLIAEMECREEPLAGLCHMTHERVRENYSREQITAQYVEPFAGLCDGGTC